ncbi:type I 3-dehydroquinate dehydratase [Shouchella miscanthi]|uniref:type I 3-dehydroquinate dehydratase n=1 Tax=Shouchella miscanthi TaxID=2598861 RepID=UPI0011A51987|nr:type I 3-dehydroquinate dehydratase [Shouchella miscanthi]
MSTIIKKMEAEHIQRPLICAPLVGKTFAAIKEELFVITKKQPGLIEWRVDFFEELHKTESVIETGKWIKENAKGIPVLFTRRSTREGGEPISLNEEQVTDLYVSVMKADVIDAVDVELSCPKEAKETILSLAKEKEIQTVMSFHDFSKTPEKEALLAVLKQAQEEGGDVGKIALMPQSLHDVLIVAEVTEEANRELTIPIITMSMGPKGALSRLFGGAFGSAVSFAVGQAASAPGQIAIDQLERVLDVIDGSQV